MTSRRARMPAHALGAPCCMYKPAMRTPILARERKASHRYWAHRPLGFSPQMPADCPGLGSLSALDQKRNILVMLAYRGRMMAHVRLA